ncbi:SMI1/KNR4 family protein [Luteolibacter sp. SL250]|uniref:SMI1/KNR4 family protein n=1 Tax=Luteolibacter sp. SL250 TaxID=2995170 RepID=UPI00226FA691|nr:SMI1/KNR4 family protein [Luteolibacter sp. SL250]WAC19570.1 SMI1/KNR4 family protein [Luteolibacter sp. SL250]
MPNWRKIVESHHAWAHPDDDWRLITGPPAGAADLALLEELFGAALKDEIRGFYEQMDGFGITSDEGRVIWFVVPIAGLADTFEACRSWFRDTHPGLAERFFPFIDWECGDYSGILLHEFGIPLEGIYEFEHEEYGFDEDQDGSDFLRSVYDSLREMLTPEDG